MQKKIKCSICNKEFIAITNTHLKKSHQLDRQGFLTLYPGYKMVSEELSARRSQISTQLCVDDPTLAVRRGEAVKRVWKEHPEINQGRIEKATATKRANPEIAKEAGRKISKLWKDEPWRLEKMVKNWKKTIEADPNIQRKRSAKLSATFHANDDAIIKQIRKSTDPKRAEMARHAAITYSKNVSNGKNIRLTKPHLKMIEVMKNNNIDGFLSEKWVFGSFCCDEVNYKKKIVIEMYGNYWHCNPKTYAPNFYHTKHKMTAQQVWDRDAARKKKIEENGWTVIVIWEDEIYENPSACADIMIRAIKEKS